MGSGGVGFLVRKALLKDFEVSLLDDSYEGVLWLRLTHRQSDENIMFCVCYLPPANSTRNIDCSDVLDTLMCQIHEYGSESVFYLCGDFNARILYDFIAGSIAFLTLCSRC